MLPGNTQHQHSTNDNIVNTGSPILQPFKQFRANCKIKTKGEITNEKAGNYIEGAQVASGQP